MQISRTFSSVKATEEFRSCILFFTQSTGAEWIPLKHTGGDQKLHRQCRVTAPQPGGDLDLSAHQPGPLASGATRFYLPVQTLNDSQFGRLLVRAYPTYIPSLHTISHSLILREPNITLLSPSSFFIVALSKETYFFSAVKSTYFLFGTHTIRRTHLINKHLLSTSICLCQTLC